jgi:hypothetical protein
VDVARSRPSRPAYLSVALSPRSLLFSGLQIGPTAYFLCVYPQARAIASVPMCLLVASEFGLCGGVDRARADIVPLTMPNSLSGVSG